MDIIKEAISGVQTMTEDCGISDSPVTLEPDVSIVPCAYEDGKVMKVTFGGRSAGVTTKDPFHTTTKPSFMYGASLKKPSQVAAAAGIINAVSSFLCRIRRPHACLPEMHVQCQEMLKSEIAGKKIWCIGKMDQIKELMKDNLAADMNDADLILVTIDGLSPDNIVEIPENLQDKVLFIGPSLAGSAAVLHGTHYCPYGRTNL